MKCLGISMSSISSKKGDLAIVLRVRLMAFLAAFGCPPISFLSDTKAASLDSFDLSLDN